MTTKHIRSAFRKTAESYQGWNPTTAECFNRKMVCDGCSNSNFCKIEALHQNPYDIPNIKYAALMTFANIGEKGIDKYVTKLAKDRTRNKEEAQKSQI